MKEDNTKAYISLRIFEIIEKILYNETLQVKNLYDKRAELYWKIKKETEDNIQLSFFDLYTKSVRKRIATKTVHFFVEGLKNTDSAFLFFNYETRTNTRIFDEMENQLLRGFEMDFAQYNKLKDINKKYEDIISFSAYKNCDTIVKTLSDLYK